ncbi:uncharacterized protein LOC143894304 [Temnothorax americanus]|uniref:uncharacterized protein LOC143894304 n=1 Tax=Temnothorax americanus TaxID=1964332 RepID=UPI004067D510
MDIKYRKGALNRVADALSRQNTAAAVTTPPRCSWYRRTLQAVQNTLREHPDYEVRDGKMYRHILHNLDFNETPPEAQWKECVAKELRSEILHQNHDALTAGHLGIAKTITRVAQLCYWPGMFREIAQYV